MTLGNLWVAILLILMAVMVTLFVTYGWCPLLSRMAWVVFVMAVIGWMAQGEEQ